MVLSWYVFAQLRLVFVSVESYEDLINQKDPMDFNLKN